MITNRFTHSTVDRHSTYAAFESAQSYVHLVARNVPQNVLKVPLFEVTRT
jgi:hypothetical protein